MCLCVRVGWLVLCNANGTTTARTINKTCALCKSIYTNMLCMCNSFKFNLNFFCCCCCTISYHSNTPTSAGTHKHTHTPTPVPRKSTCRTSTTTTTTTTTLYTISDLHNLTRPVLVMFKQNEVPSSNTHIYTLSYCSKCYFCQQKVVTPVLFALPCSLSRRSG